MIRSDRYSFLKYGSYALLMLGLFLLQSSRGTALWLWGASVDVLPFFVAATALMDGPYAGGAFGFAAGVLASLNTPGVEGFSSLYLSLFGVLFGLFGACYLRNILFSALSGGALCMTLQSLFRYVFHDLLFYGMGGGSNYGGSVLDGDIVAGNINDMIQAYGDFADKGNVVISYKFSPAFADSVYSQTTLAGTPVEAGQKSFEDYKGQTYRFALEKGKNIIESFADDKVYGPMESDYANPDSLTNFINWAVKEYPAKKYILVLTDHGGGYMPHYDLQYNKTRYIMNEATYRTSFSVHSLKYALQRANVHFDALYFDACLMNSLEYLYELKNQTDYLLRSRRWRRLSGTVGAAWLERQPRECAEPISRPPRKVLGLLLRR